jgi:hypothetical protein
MRFEEAKVIEADDLSARHSRDLLIEFDVMNRPNRGCLDSDDLGLDLPSGNHPNSDERADRAGMKSSRSKWE